MELHVKIIDVPFLSQNDNWANKSLSSQDSRAEKTASQTLPPLSIFLSLRVSNLNFYICPLVYLAMIYLSFFMNFAYLKHPPGFHITAQKQVPWSHGRTALGLSTKPFLVGVPCTPTPHSTPTVPAEGSPPFTAHPTQRCVSFQLSHLGHTETGVLI